MLSPLLLDAMSGAVLHIFQMRYSGDDGSTIDLDHLEEDGADEESYQFDRVRNAVGVMLYAYDAGATSKSLKATRNILRVLETVFEAGGPKVSNWEEGIMRLLRIRHQGLRREPLLIQAADHS